MLLLQWIVAVVTITSIMAAMHLSWAWLRLRNHPHIETIEIAKPEIATELKHMIKGISTIAGISPPPLFIRRGRLPSAFVVAAISRPELYISDEMLENCSNIESGLAELERVVCHEIAHIQRGDALKIGMFTYGTQCSNKLTLKGVENIFQSAIDRIERETDKQAEVIFLKISS